jgi:hypoxanthine phosphoribosyltransferase
MVSIKWEEVEKYCDDLVLQIEDDVRGKPNTIIAVSRGGLVPATLMSYKLGMSDIEVIHPLVSRDRVESEVKFLRGYYSDLFNVLIVDDILKSGVTIDAVLKFPYFDGIRVACLHIMKDLRSDLKPDYYISEVEEEITYPWHRS